MRSLVKVGDDPNDAIGGVFGTFGVESTISEFDRLREDGYHVLDFVPDCRVFVYGADLSKDVLDVNVNNSIGGNTCDITLANPRGKYEITKQDLMGKWREDKDILAAYAYPDFDRITPNMYSAIMDKLSSTAVFGKKTQKRIQNVQKGLNIAKQAGNLLGNPFGMPTAKGSTRQIFETKFFSGLTKNSGDVVFDYKDPVYVFFKGRFSRLWYFGFSGIVTGWEDTDTYGQEQVIKLRCEDVLTLWRRAKMTVQGAMYNFSRGTERFGNTEKGTSSFFYDDWATAFSFSELIKIIVYSFDFGRSAYNCHISKPGKTAEDLEKFHSLGETSAVDLTNATVYKEYRRRLNAEALIDDATASLSISSGVNYGTYMFTRNTSWDATWGQGEASMGEAGAQWDKSKTSNSGGTKSMDRGGIAYATSGLVDIKKIRHVHGDLLGTSEYALNNSPFSPPLALYTQFNSIEFPQGIPFTGKNLRAYLDISVRYWEAGHLIKDPLKQVPTDNTGWDDNKAFGVCGAHPALTYEFINNFNILGNIWEQCYKYKRNLDYLVMTPHDKIKSMVAGNPTEMTTASNKTNKKTGTNFDFFRPRLFLVLPRRFSDKFKTANTGNLKGFSNLFNESATVIYDYLTEKLKSIEFVMYTSPSGDIYMEPELYDFHPLEFSGKIDVKDIVSKATPIQFRDVSGDTKTTKPNPTSAYMFDTNANHPFFIMEKDRLRSAQTFDHKLIQTEVVVKGGQTDRGSILDVISDDMMAMSTSIAMASKARGYDKNVQYANGHYIADGFQSEFEEGAELSILAKAIEEEKALLNSTAALEIIGLLGNYNMLHYVLTFVDNAVKSATAENFALRDAAPFHATYGDVANAVKTELVTRYGATWETNASPYNIALTTVRTSFSSLLPYLVDTKKYGSKNISTYLFVQKDPPKKTDNNKKNASTTKAQNSTLETIFKSISVTDPTAKDEYIKAVKNVSNVDVTSSDGNTQVFADLIKLGIPQLVIVNSSIATLLILNVLEADTRQYNESSIIEVKSLYDEKRLAKSGLYHPGQNMVKHYGYVPKHDITNRYIKTGQEAYDYARTVFNRLKGKAFKIDMSVLGRPEFCLNRPYYCERKDAIGLLASHSISFRYGQSFHSDVQLEYVRKNAISYSYSQGVLDPFYKSSLGNSYFNKQADTYYKYNSLAMSLAERAKNSSSRQAYNKFDPKSDHNAERAAKARLKGNIKGAIVGAFANIGGVYVAHDKIGHIPFDTRFGAPTGTEDVPVGVGLSNDGNVLVPSVLKDIADEITKSIIAINKITDPTAKLEGSISYFDEAVSTKETEQITWTAKIRNARDSLSILFNKPGPGPWLVPQYITKPTTVAGVKKPVNKTEQKDISFPDLSKAKLAWRSMISIYESKLNNVVSAIQTNKDYSARAKKDLESINRLLYGDTTISTTVDMSIKNAYTVLQGRREDEKNNMTMDRAMTIAAGYYYKLFKEHVNFFRTYGSSRQFTINPAGYPAKTVNSDEQIMYYIVTPTAKKEQDSSQ
jgi:hypothetical protein